MSNEKLERRAKFERAFEIIRNELVAHLESQGMPRDAVDWYRKNLDYNVPGGKLNRGMSVVDTVEIIKGHKLDDGDYHRAAVLGWCVELLQGFFLVSDDIMDSSITRRSQPCWYRLPEIGMIAINDAFMLEAAIYHLIKTYFRQEKYYVDLLELFHETTHKTEMGQLIDLITAPEDVVDLNKFSLEKHRLIVLYKTAYYSFYLPVALAMLMCHIPTSYSVPSPSQKNEQVTVHPYTIANDILLPLGEYFQVQDDFLDFSGTPEQIGKIGTDIVDNKCSWCVCTALKLASADQRKVLDENYGKKGAGAGEATGKDGGESPESKVKRVFEELKLREVYATYEEGAYKRLNEMIEGIVEGEEIGNGEGRLKKEIFRSFLEKIYKRSK